MKKMMFALTALAVLVFASASPARAQGDVQIVKVPVRFIVNGQLLPAGTYRITKSSPDGSVLMIAAENRRVEPVLFATDSASGPTEDGVVRLQLKNYRGQYFLSTVEIPGEDVRAVVLRAPEMNHTLAKLNLLGPEQAVGASAR